MSPGNNRAPQPASQGDTSGRTTNLNTHKGSRIGPPCGDATGEPHECGIGQPIPVTPRHVEASRAAWSHLAWLGLVDSEGFVADVLRPGGRRAS
jgi:hypothetical protein